LYQAVDREDRNVDFLNRMIYVELKQRLAELLLMRVDKMSMAASVEARVPFLDVQLVEFAMQLPTAWKINEGGGQRILRTAVNSLLPPEILARRKQGFCGSAANMLHPAVMQKLIADLRQSPFINELFRSEAIARLTQPESQSVNGFKLWNLWNLALWHKRWFR